MRGVVMPRVVGTGIWIWNRSGTAFVLFVLDIAAVGIIIAVHCAFTKYRADLEPLMFQVPDKGPSK